MPPLAPIGVTAPVEVVVEGFVTLFEEEGARLGIAVLVEMLDAGTRLEEEKAPATAAETVAFV